MLQLPKLVSTQQLFLQKNPRDLPLYCWNGYSVAWCRIWLDLGFLPWQGLNLLPMIFFFYKNLALQDNKINLVLAMLRWVLMYIFKNIHRGCDLAHVSRHPLTIVQPKVLSK